MRRKVDSTAGEKERIGKQSTEKENQDGGSEAGRMTQRIFMITDHNTTYKTGLQICKDLYSGNRAYKGSDSPRAPNLNTQKSKREAGHEDIIARGSQEEQVSQGQEDQQDSGPNSF
ncbi:hypothetical protein BTVI_95107 [Pitangus sulphuratus]|nr:hypothetical protein BTVI_95107 [Pitangus sulphuratus]